MSVKSGIGLALGFAIGFVCAAFNIPVPAPPALTGALLVLAITCGYILTDRALARTSPKLQSPDTDGAE